jgi:ABC-type Fe3+ transport system permease subunit
LQTRSRKLARATTPGTSKKKNALWNTEWVSYLWQNEIGQALRKTLVLAVLLCPDRRIA